MPLYLVTYDIANPRRLRRIARICERHGQRVQESVFLMELQAPDLIGLMHALARLIDPLQDSVRYVPVCGEDLRLSSGLGLCSGLRAAPGCWVV